MIIEVKVKPPSQWCWDEPDPDWFPGKTVKIDTELMHEPCKGNRGISMRPGRVWAVLDGEGAVICEHNIEIGD